MTNAKTAGTARGDKRRVTSAERLMRQRMGDENEGLLRLIENDQARATGMLHHTSAGWWHEMVVAVPTGWGIEAREATMLVHETGVRAESGGRLECMVVIFARDASVRYSVMGWRFWECVAKAIPLALEKMIGARGDRIAAKASRVMKAVEQRESKGESNG